MWIGSYGKIPTAPLQRSGRITMSLRPLPPVRFSGDLHVVTFGFSAFLKILSLNDKPQRTEIRKRLAPSSGDGYDFHRRFRQLARLYMVEDAPLSDVLAAAAAIIQLPERVSAVTGLNRLALWRAKVGGQVLDFSSVVIESPGHQFKVRFEPDFGMLIRDKPTAIHLWNTKSVELSPAATYAALALVAQAYGGQESGPDDLGVLSMRAQQSLYRLSQVTARSPDVVSIVERIEGLIRGTVLVPQPAEARPSA
jgi:hypothetical protein